MICPVVALSFPSPRLRGEGAERTNVSEAGEGALLRLPLTRLATLADLSPRAGRGESRAEIAR